jgi:hypothetical protein
MPFDAVAYRGKGGKWLEEFELIQGVELVRILRWCFKQVHMIDTSKYQGEGGGPTYGHDAHSGLHCRRLIFVHFFKEKNLN